jgi:hypothetical protein
MMVKLDYFFEAVVSVSLPIISSLTMLFAFDQLQAPHTPRLLVNDTHITDITNQLIMKHTTIFQLIQISKFFKCIYPYL